MMIFVRDQSGGRLSTAFSFPWNASQPLICLIYFLPLPWWSSPIHCRPTHQNKLHFGNIRVLQFSIKYNKKSQSTVLVQRPLTKDLQALSTTAARHFQLLPSWWHKDRKAGLGPCNTSRIHTRIHTSQLCSCRMTAPHNVSFCFLVVLGTRPRDLCMPSKHSIHHLFQLTKST